MKRVFQNEKQTIGGVSRGGGRMDVKVKHTPVTPKKSQAPAPGTDKTPVKQAMDTSAMKGRVDKSGGMPAPSVGGARIMDTTTKQNRVSREGAK